MYTVYTTYEKIRMADLQCINGNRKYLEYYLKDCLTHINDHIVPLYSSPFNFGTLLCSAIQGKSIECIKYLLDNGADPNICDEYGRPPLIFTFHKFTDDAKLTEIITLLLKAGANPNIPHASFTVGYMYPIVYADKGGHSELVKMLINRGAHETAYQVEEQLSESTINMIERVYDRRFALLALYNSSIPLDIITNVIIKECL